MATVAAVIPDNQVLNMVLGASFVCRVAPQNMLTGGNFDCTGYDAGGLALKICTTNEVHGGSLESQPVTSVSADSGGIEFSFGDDGVEILFGAYHATNNIVGYLLCFDSGGNSVLAWAGTINISGNRAQVVGFIQP
jgi:hypothetical protein